MFPGLCKVRLAPHRLLSTNAKTPYRIMSGNHSTNKRQQQFVKHEQGSKKKSNNNGGADGSIIVTEKISQPKNKDAIDKLSHVQLSEEQQELKGKILTFVRDNIKPNVNNDKPALFVIEGDAGTGKSVILNSLFNDIQKIASQRGNDVLNGSENYLVVNHPEMLKLYHRIARSFPYLSIKHLERPTSLVNKLAKDGKKCDLIIVDEAHLLSTSKDAFKRFYGENHLEELMKLCKAMVIVYDEKQSLRMGSYWSSDGNGSSLSPFIKQSSSYETYYLKKQFRVTAEQDVQDWILSLSTTKKISSYPTTDRKRSLAGDKDAFDFKVWEDAGEMYEALKIKDEEFGQCRILCTYDFPYRLGTKDWYVTCGDNFKLRWDRYLPKIQTPWSERPDTIEEVGSVYTIQGFDLNYAGVILGRSIGYDEEKDELKIMPEFYDDNAGFTKKKNIKEPDMVKEKIILNSINVLLTRGVRGLYIYAWDDKLRARLLRDAK